MGRIAPRLRKNQKLARHLDQGRQYGYMWSSVGLLQRTMTIPCDCEKVVELFKFVARGLAFHHWDVLMPDTEVALFGGFVIPDGARIMESMLASKVSRGTGRQQWGLRDFDSDIEQRLIAHIQARTNATLSWGRLEQTAREWLYRAYVAIPRSRALTVLAAASSNPSRSKIIETCGDT